MEWIYTALLLVAGIQAVSCATLKTCGGNLNGPYGDFQSPGFPNKYPTDRTCTWRLQVPTGHYVRVTFTEFQVEEHSVDCDYDKVLVMEGPNNTEIGKFCGTPNSDGPKGPIESKGNSAVVQLISDYSEAAQGFWAHFAACDIDECAVDNGGCNHFCNNYIGGYYCSCRSGYELQSDGKFCKVVCNGMEKTDLQGVIQSPEFPNIYPNQAECDWKIDLPLGYQIEWTFTNIDIEEHDDVKCPYDYVKINNGHDLEKYCGKSVPGKIISRANMMHVFFVSDDSVGHTGFRATYKAKPLDCGNPGTPVNGTKTGNNYLFPNSVSYSCDPGFLLVGSATRTCQNNGLWSGSPASCQRVSCGDPGVPLHGSRKIIAGVGRNYVFEDKVELKCNHFYSKGGGDKYRTCLQDGSWSGSQLSCNPICGKRTFYNREKIIGGSTARHGWYPWMVMLYSRPCTARHCIFCGGSILNNNYVLTAAHCLNGDKNFVLRVGAHQAKANVSEEWWCTVKRKLTHPSYDKETFDYDIALIEVDACFPVDMSLNAANEIVMSDYIRPICLPTPSETLFYKVGRLGKAAGWGRRNLTNINAIGKVLRHIEIPVANTQNCQNHFALQNWPVTPRMFCARDGDQDTCQGDSGGPFMVYRQRDKKFIVSGVISWGDSQCASGYGVYTKVADANIVNWIKMTIQN